MCPQGIADLNIGSTNSLVTSQNTQARQGSSYPCPLRDKLWKQGPKVTRITIYALQTVNKHPDRLLFSNRAKIDPFCMQGNIRETEGITNSTLAIKSVFVYIIKLIQRSEFPAKSPCIFRN